jgi:prolyl 4-hydroxylase
MEGNAVILHDDPYIAYYAQFTTRTECDELIKLAQNQLEPSKVVEPTGLAVTNARISENTWLQHDSTESVQRLCERIASIVGRSLVYAEQLQVARYRIGGKFNAHFDSFELSTASGKKYLEEGGQRLITAILYLNDVDEGGETAFPELDLSVAARQGDMLIFENCRRSTNERHPQSLHEGRPVKKGEKWIATLWFRERPLY